MSSPSDRSARSSVLRLVLCVTCLAVVLALLVWRQQAIMLLPGRPHEGEAQGRVGLGDFRDVVYYPQQAVRDGVNPYDASLDARPDGSLPYRRRYPVLNLFPLYSPLLFVLYWPFGWLPFEASAAVYVVANVGLMLGFAWCVLRLSRLRADVAHVCLLAAVILATNAGRSNFLGGENALPLALGTIGALAWSERSPGLAGLCLALTSMKPTFGLPLGIVLLAAGHWRTTLIGWGLGGAIGLAGLAIVFGIAGDLPRAPEVLRNNQAVLESDPDVDAKTSVRRVDAAGALERIAAPLGAPSAVWSGVVVGLAIVAVRLSRALPADEKSRIQHAIACLAVIAGIYHLSYDAIVLWSPIVTLLALRDEAWPTLDRRSRLVIGALVLYPMVNVLATQPVIDGVRETVRSGALSPAAGDAVLWTASVSSGLALLAALGMIVVALARRNRESVR